MSYILIYIVIGLIVTTLFWLWGTPVNEYTEEEGSPMLAILPLAIICWPLLIIGFLMKI